MFSIAAINDTDSKRQWQPLAPTKEALEFHLSQTYHEGLSKLQAKDYKKARELLEAVLQDPLVSSAQLDDRASDGHLLQLRFLALKNLATVFLQQGSVHYENALNCYLQAVEIDAKDSVAWNQLGTLACSMGLLSTSRWAFEQGLFCSPNNWNCMEKLLEVLIAIGDEVACLFVTNLILRHWPSHTRALHVKQTIEDGEPMAFAPRGIDKLEPKHVRLKFPEKRKATNENTEGDRPLKRVNPNVEITLSVVTWEALADEILGILIPVRGKVYELAGNEDSVAIKKTEKAHPNIVNESTLKEGDNFEPGTGISKGITMSADVRITVTLPLRSEPIKDSSGSFGDTDSKKHLFSDVGRTSISKERESCTDDEHPHERRSTRLERLRSRKPGKEELDAASAKDLAKIVFQFLEPFILNSKKKKDNYLNDCHIRRHPGIPEWLPDKEYNDIVKFINSASKNYGAYHLGHLLLEEIACKEITYRESSAKFLDLEKMTREWPQDRSPSCNLFLAELYYDHGIDTSNESKQLEFFAEASYHLCKVIELVALDSDCNLFHSMSHAWDSNSFVDADNSLRNLLPPDSVDVTKSIGVSNSSVSREKFECQESMTPISTSDKDHAFWIRFSWLSASLSLASGVTSKAIENFSVCLSVLRNHSKLNNPDSSDSCILLPHCKHIRWLSINRVLHQINVLKIQTLLRQATDMAEKGRYRDCIELLVPLLHSPESVYSELLSGEEGQKSDDLLALDILLSACEKVEPLEFEVLLNSHRRKLLLITTAAGMLDPSAFEISNEKFRLKAGSADYEQSETVLKQWNHMVAQEVREISRCASLVKNFFDQNGVSDGLSTLMCIVSDIQSTLLKVMCSFARIILGQKLSGSVNVIEADQMETQCLVDAAIAFCKLQHLDPSVPVKVQVDLIAAVHDLLAEYGLCCAGKDSEGKEGAFLKLAIKHLLALDVKLKSSALLLNEKAERNQVDRSISVDGLEKGFASHNKSSSSLDVAVHEKVEPESSPKIAQEESAPECLSVPGVQLNNQKGLETGKDITDLVLHREHNSDSKVSDISSLLVDADREKVELGIDNALDQSFFCLYGLDLKSGQDSSCDDELAIHKNTNRGDYQTKEQCADVFHYILPYAKVSSRSGIVKLKRVLRAIRKHFPQPPDDILADTFIDKFLDSTDLCEEKLFEIAAVNENQEAVMNILHGSAREEISRKMSALTSGPYLDVYSNLYYYIGHAEEISATDKFAGFVLNKEGEDFVEQNANLFIYDLLYNPLRFESWEKLANIYDEEVDLLLNDGSKHVTIVDWRKNSTLLQRVERGRRRSRRCLLMSLTLARTPVEQSQIHELLGLVYYDSLQNVVPFYDQRTVIPRRDSEWLEFCQKSLKNFERAFSLKPDWIHAFYLGKLCEKLGHSPEKVFSYYNQAILLNPTAVDPFYRMHASRLKLLFTSGNKNIDTLRTVALYSFNQSAKQSVFDIFDWTNQDTVEHSMDAKDGSLHDDFMNTTRPIPSYDLDKAWHLLYDDCLSALEICTDGELKHYHKARYMLAQGLIKRSESGDLERAKDELSFCFRSSRSSFTINMWEIDGTVKKGKRKSLGLGGNKRILEVTLPESSRKFITCIRKYILLYLNLLEKSKDFCTLDRAYVYLRTDRRFSICIADLVPLALGRYIKVLTMSILNTGTIVSSDACTSIGHLLERMFHVLMDHVNLWADVICLPEIKCPQVTEASLYGFIHQYIHSLENDTRVDALEIINEKIRKRFKNPKLANPDFAKICKHASLAWCRCIIVKLALITPTCDTGISAAQSSDIVENGMLLFVDVQPSELYKFSFEGDYETKDLEMKWYKELSRIRNTHIKQALDQNMEAATLLLKCAYTFYRDSSCGTFPSGVSLCTGLSSQLVAEEPWQPGQHGVDMLDLSIPRKLLLWAYTLVHGHYSNILAVVKYCEENAKTKVKRGVTVPYVGQTGNEETKKRISERSLPEERAAVVESSLAPIDTTKLLFPASQIHLSTTNRDVEGTEGEGKK